MTDEVDIKARNNELLPRVIAGDAEAKDEMIVLNMGLVMFKVESYIGSFPHLEYLRDDLVGEANLALVEAVEHVFKGNKVHQVGGFLSILVQRSIGRVIDNELTTTSGRSRDHRRRNGDVETQYHKVPNSDFVLSQMEVDTRKEDGLQELILESCESDEERAIVDLRIKGYKDDEIASQLDIPKTTIFMLRRELHQRLVAARDITSD